MRHTEQKIPWDGWADAIENQQLLCEAWKHAHTQHPIDRRAADTILLTDASHLPQWAETSTRVMTTLCREIGSLHPEAR
jgi:transcriptional regulator of met regulon